jgi:hypothetical protein
MNDEPKITLFEDGADITNYFPEYARQRMEMRDTLAEIEDPLKHEEAKLRLLKLVAEWIIKQPDSTFRS